MHGSGGAARPSAGGLAGMRHCVTAADMLTAAPPRHTGSNAAMRVTRRLLHGQAAHAVCLSAHLAGCGRRVAAAEVACGSKANERVRQNHSFCRTCLGQ